MPTEIPKGFEEISRQMAKDNREILAALEKNYKIEQYPKIGRKNALDGEALASAYPIQGILKYHGMSDWKYRIAYLPSISVNNDAAKSLTYVKFDSSMKNDRAFINGKEAAGRDLERVQQSLDYVRKIAGAETRALVVSRNEVRATKTGKGLGTSASASAAIAVAAVSAALGKEATKNNRFVSTIARFLAGSGCRSAAGGISLWLSYPGISHEDSFALRLDDKNQLKDVSLITVPVDSRIGLKTEDAHKDAPNSPFFKEWMKGRKGRIFEAVQAVRKGDWKTIGKIAELDTICLHGVTMSGSTGNKIIAWEPETIRLMRLANELRSSGVPVYYSIDTGPTPIFITHKDYEDRVVKGIEALGGFEVIRGKIAGPAELLPLEQKKELLRGIKI